MPKLIVEYKNYTQENLDTKLEKVVGKLISKCGFSKGNRKLEFVFLSPKACKDASKKAKELHNVVSIEIEENT